MLAILRTLAQLSIDPDGNQLDGRPPLTADVGTSGLTWVMAVLLIAAILLVTFKTSKRNHLDRT
jgi:hypothetical protein